VNETATDRLLKIGQVEEMTGLSRRYIYRLMREERFPRQFKPGGYASRWSENEVVAWRDRQRSAR